MADVIYRICSKCGKKKLLYAFNKDSARKDGFYPQCKNCRNELATPTRRKWRKSHKNHDKITSLKSYYKHRGKRLAAMKSRSSEYKKNSVIKSVYGITLDEYNKMFNKQNGVCAICGQPETRKNKYTGICKLHIDHCHKTNKVRGLLCHSCNSAIGIMDDDIGILMKAINYLKSHNKEELK